MIYTERLKLEPLLAEHAGLMFEGLSNEALYNYIPDQPPATVQNLEKRYRFLQDGASLDEKEVWLNWIVFFRQSQTPMGYVQSTINLSGRSQIAYLLFQEHWKQGYATEAVAAAVEYIFSQYDTPVIEAFIDTRNLASQALVSKLGFTVAETILQADFFKGVSSDEYRYELAR